MGRIKIDRLHHHDHREDTRTLIEFSYNRNREIIFTSLHITSYIKGLKNDVRDMETKRI